MMTDDTTMSDAHTQPTDEPHSEENGFITNGKHRSSEETEERLVMNFDPEEV
ncbi:MULTISPECIES: hypothetical protein [Halorubrum]|uniref:hypothetical protein n=1 Tax=Halorubrum TaxID=56688 RepID=UPI001EF9DCBE|nr:MULTISPECIES: hypothetical protein [Halorubrum]